MEWCYVWRPWLTSKRVARVCQHQLSISWASHYLLSFLVPILLYMQSRTEKTMPPSTSGFLTVMDWWFILFKPWVVSLHAVVRDLIILRMWVELDTHVKFFLPASFSINCPSMYSCTAVFLPQDATHKLDTTRWRTDRWQTDGRTKKW